MSNFPLMLLPLVGYNLLVFLFGGVAWDEPMARIEMISGAEWTMTPGDVFILVTLFLLFFEILKAARAHHTSIVDHILSTLVFIACLVEFLLVAEAATSTFFLFTAIAFIDVVAGFSVSIRTARRDFAIGPNAEF